MMPTIHRGGPRFWADRDARQHRAIMAAIRGGRPSVTLPRSNVGVAGVYTAAGPDSALAQHGGSGALARRGSVFLQDRQRDRDEALSWARKAAIVGGLGVVTVGGVLLARYPSLRLGVLRRLADARPLRPLRGMFGDLETLAQERGVTIARNVTSVVAAQARKPVTAVERALIGHFPEVLEQQAVRGTRTPHIGGAVKAGLSRITGTVLPPRNLGGRVNVATVRVPTIRLPFIKPLPEAIAPPSTAAELLGADVARGDLPYRSLLRRIADSAELEDMRGTGSEHMVPGLIQKAGVALKRPLTHLPYIGPYIDPEHELKFGAAAFNREAYLADVDRSVASAMRKVSESPRIRDQLLAAKGPARSTYLWQGERGGWLHRKAVGPKTITETYRLQGQARPFMQVRVPAGVRHAMPRTDTWSALQARIARNEATLRTVQPTSPDRVEYLARVRTERDALKARAQSLLQRRRDDIFGAQMDARYRDSDRMTALPGASKAQRPRRGGKIVKRWQHWVPLTPARRREIEQATLGRPR